MHRLQKQPVVFAQRLVYLKAPKRPWNMRRNPFHWRRWRVICCCVAVSLARLSVYTVSIVCVCRRWACIRNACVYIVKSKRWVISTPSSLLLRHMWGWQHMLNINVWAVQLRRALSSNWVGAKPSKYSFIWRAFGALFTEVDRTDGTKQL